MFLLFGFTILKYFTDFDLAEFSKTTETFNYITGPIIASIAAYLVWTSFKQQVRANEIQSEAIKVERKRYEIDKGYDQALHFIQEVHTFSQYIDKYGDSGAGGWDSLQEFINYLKELDAYSRRPDKTQPMYTHNHVKMYFKDFSDSFIQHLEVISLTADYIIRFQKLGDDSFLILKKKFFKEVQEIREPLEMMLLFDHLLKEDYPIVMDLKIIFKVIDSTIEKMNQLVALDNIKN